MRPPGVSKTLAAGPAGYVVPMQWAMKRWHRAHIVSLAPGFPLYKCGSLVGKPYCGIPNKAGICKWNPWVQFCKSHDM